MRDSAFSGIRDVADRMLTMIDVALSSPPAEPVTMSDIDTLSSGLLLRELAKRIRVNRHTEKTCSRCKTYPARARGLCVKCYKKAYRRGEIHNASR
jgi:uncharacterized paraquat-inducible protein A